MNTYTIKSDETAAVRYMLNQSEDPFPDIEPALMNNADIFKYIEKAGIVYPFDEKRLKSASYEVNLGNEVLYWDKDGEMHNEKEIRNDDFITFRRNSITFVTTECTFRIPPYIALRFNLTIKHVHRGLLLGTGPLVDPGYVGKLMIPIHNLTPNDYKASPGTPLIAVEFTKISPHKKWSTRGNPDQIDYVGNKKPQKPDFEYYLRKSLPIEFNSIRSSLSDEFNKYERRIEEISSSHKETLTRVQDKTERHISNAERTTEELSKKTEHTISEIKKSTLKWNLGSITAVIIGVVTLLIYVSDANKYVADANNFYNSEFSGAAEKVAKTVLDKTISASLTSVNNEISKNHNDLIEIEDSLEVISESTKKSLGKTLSNEKRVIELEAIVSDLKYQNSVLQEKSNKLELLLKSKTGKGTND